ncbi:MAG: aminoacyl-tRNA hydrolase [bacterium]
MPNLNSNVVIVAALGNPDKKYIKTRHNAGFIFADKVASFFKFPPFLYCEKIDGGISVGEISGKTVILLKPATYMNRSGLSVVKAFAAFRAEHKSLIVVHDDSDINFGKYKVKTGGGDGGHRGVRSIAAEIGTVEFARIRIGVGPAPSNLSLSDFVLANFFDEELQVINDSLSLEWNDVLIKTVSSISPSGNAHVL